MELPVKGEKTARRIEERTVFILRCLRKGMTGKESGLMAVRKRPPSGILASLYEFPNLMGEMTADQALQQAEDWGCRPTGLTRSLKCRHVFTHVEWHMTGYYITCAEQGGPEQGQPEQGGLKQNRTGGDIPFRWITEEELNQEVPLPSAFQYFL